MSTAGAQFTIRYYDRTVMTSEDVEDVMPVRSWVFESDAKGLKLLGKECLSFAAGRLATLGMEELMLWIGIDLLHVNNVVVKVIAQVAVVIGNYVISKWLVFRHS